MIITGGENVSSIEVEDVLFSHPAVAEVAVIGVPDEKWGETVKALVVLAPGARVTQDELIRFCKERLAGFKAPTSVEFREELARTTTGKLQKYKLREPYWEGHERGRWLSCVTGLVLVGVLGDVEGDGCAAAAARPPAPGTPPPPFAPDSPSKMRQRHPHRHRTGGVAKSAGAFRQVENGVRAASALVVDRSWK